MYVLVAVVYGEGVFFGRFESLEAANEVRKWLRVVESEGAMQVGIVEDKDGKVQHIGVL